MFVVWWPLEFLDYPECFGSVSRSRLGVSELRHVNGKASGLPDSLTKVHNRFIVHSLLFIDRSEYGVRKGTSAIRSTFQGLFGRSDRLVMIACVVVMPTE